MILAKQGSAEYARLRGCELKRAYKSKGEARKIAKGFGKGNRAYFCRYCGMWHCGHSSKPAHKTVYTVNDAASNKEVPQMQTD